MARQVASFSSELLPDGRGNGMYETVQEVSTAFLYMKTLLSTPQVKIIPSGSQPTTLFSQMDLAHTLPQHIHGTPTGSQSHVHLGLFPLLLTGYPMRVFLVCNFVHHRVLDFIMPYYCLTYRLLDDSMTSANSKVQAGKWSWSRMYMKGT